MIKLIYNYFKLCIKLYTFDKDDVNNVNTLFDQIVDCGSVCIKITQWILPILEMKYKIEYDNVPYWFSKLENLYDNCNYHCDDYTRRVYLDEFNNEFSDKYKMIKVLSSGSMGGCYHIKSIDDDKDFCMKVIHPNIKYEMKILTYLFKIPFFQNIFHKIVPISFEIFFDKFKEQINMIKEANNILQFRENYSKDELILIPKLYAVSSDILIMEYLPSYKLSEVDISDYKKTKLLSILFLFMRNNGLLNFNHGDLHKGNWGINDNKIVIYDFGICWKYSQKKSKHNLKLVDLFDTEYAKDPLLFEKFSTILFELMDHTFDRDDFLKYAKISNEKYELNKLDVKSIYNIVIRYFIERDKIMDYTFFIGIINVLQVNKIMLHYDVVNGRADIEWLNSKRKDLIDICEAYDSFKEYSNYYKDTLQNESIDYNYIQDKITQNLN
tara:strand:+ start:797 stop:2113 length:1317 start_codon:yes stop_codon:yes gene_type:complete